MSDVTRRHLLIGATGGLALAASAGAAAGPATGTVTFVKPKLEWAQVRLQAIARANRILLAVSADTGRIMPDTQRNAIVDRLVRQSRARLEKNYQLVE